MTSLTPGDVVWVPFPHVEENRLRPRPALVVATGLGPDASLCWAMMITNAERASWPGDLVIADHAALRLPIPSKIRIEKIATLDASRATLLGRLPDAEMAIVAERLARYTGGQAV